MALPVRLPPLRYSRVPQPTQVPIEPARVADNATLVSWVISAGFPHFAQYAVLSLLQSSSPAVRSAAVAAQNPVFGNGELWRGFRFITYPEIPQGEFTGRFG